MTSRSPSSSLGTALVALSSCLAAACGSTAPNRSSSDPAMLESKIQALLAESDAIPAERRDALDEAAADLAARLAAGEDLRLVFICTHNSRRSHLSQVWAQTGADWFGLERVSTFSGGTEATAFNPRAVAALRRAGFAVAEPTGDAINPVYQVERLGDRPALACWSKVFTEEPNPQSGHVAVMTCSSADQACPYVPGAVARYAIAYDDPKASDGTAEEAATYDARCAEIGREMLFWMRRVSERLAAVSR
jgi:arsenate reductase